jgi:hypothetical protein
MNFTIRTFSDSCLFRINAYLNQLRKWLNTLGQPRYVALKRSVSIAVDGGKSLSACLRAWPKPEFRQARHQREAQRQESFKRRAFFFLVLFLSWRHKKEKEHSWCLEI